MNLDKPLAIFDLDGTIYKTESVSLAAVHQAVSDQKLPQPRDSAIITLFGFTTPEVCKKLFPRLPELEVEQLSEQVRHYERELIAEKGALYPGVIELLNQLKADSWELALCTNGSPVYVDTVLDGLNLRDFFEEICVRDGINSKSDHLKNLASPRSDLVVMVGDRKGDIDAALNNGIESVGVAWGYGTREEIQNANYIADSVSELQEILTGLADSRWV